MQVFKEQCPSIQRSLPAQAIPGKTGTRGGRFRAAAKIGTPDHEERCETIRSKAGRQLQKRMNAHARDLCILSPGF
jgi:hypothetical protein